MKRLAVGSVVVGMLLAACGTDEVASVRGAGRTVEILIVDNRFAPKTLQLGEGQTLRFVFTIAGGVTREAILGGEAVRRNTRPR